MLRTILLIMLIFSLPIAAIVIMGSANYEVILTSDTVIYPSIPNMPLDQMPVMVKAKKGSLITALGCIDDKNDIYYHVKTEDGRTGYIYDFNYKIYRKWIFSRSQYDYFRAHPVDSVQCHIMIDEYAHPL